VERQPEAETLGWGITLNREVLSFGDDDPFWSIRGRRTVWGSDVLRESVIEMGGIARADLLQRMKLACREAGVSLTFEQDAAQLTDGELDGHDLVLIADGARSRLRGRAAEHFGVTKRPHDTCFVWLGTDARFDGITLLLSEDDALAAVAWAYPYSSDRSTFVVEMREEHWRSRGLAAIPPVQSTARLEAAFRSGLRGGRLLVHSMTRWEAFRWVRTQALAWRNRVLLGDAAFTKHFCMGVGTYSALMDSAKLAETLAEAPSTSAGLERYQNTRWAELRDLAERSERRANSIVELLDAMTTGDAAVVRALVAKENL
jgi:anthraniloyl-CoA monooxygenase